LVHSYTYIPYSETGYFSKLAGNYTAGGKELEAFQSFAPDAYGIDKAIKARPAYPADRQRLVTALNGQYASLTTTDTVKHNIASLLGNNTYTITTAHQPNLMTGYLYFIYKILHAIKLAEELNTKYPDNHFVPVYYMGSEDNDLEELGTFRFRGDNYTWDGNGQKGAVGRMDTASLKPMLQELFRFFGPAGKNCDDLQKMITDAYQKQKTIGQATKHLVNELFGRFGLVILDPDDALLKEAYIPVMEDELLNGNALELVTAQTTLLEEKGYKSQIFPRPINLFYLHHQIRERIERQGESWVVLNTDIVFNKEQLLSELHTHPERFSPNVALRGMFQETILPDVAFIGGGAEVAYWLQLGSLFAHYRVFYPVILLRQSVLWVSEQQSAMRQRSGLSVEQLFQKELTLINSYVNTHSQSDWHTTAETEEITAIMTRLQHKAATVDATLLPAAKAVLARITSQLANLEKKMLRAEKKKMQVQLSRISQARNSLFPNNSLQERTDNFLEYYLDNGPAFIDAVKEGIQPLSGKFMVIE
jgi:bacillithiol synthase